MTLTILSNRRREEILELLEPRKGPELPLVAQMHRAINDLLSVHDALNAAIRESGVVSDERGYFCVFCNSSHGLQSDKIKHDSTCPWLLAQEA